MDFAALRAERHALANAVIPHAASVLWFRPAGLPWFRLEADEVVKDEDPDHVHHLSTTASCLESLADVPGFLPGGALANAARDELAASFGDKALSRPFAKWESEGSAHVYCRARSLPAILATAPGAVLAKHEKVIRAHVEFVWDRVEVNDPLCQGVAEIPPEAGRQDATEVAKTLAGEAPGESHEPGESTERGHSSAPTDGTQPLKPRGLAASRPATRTTSAAIRPMLSTRTGRSDCCDVTRRERRCSVSFRTTF